MVGSRLRNVAGFFFLNIMREEAYSIEGDHIFQDTINVIFTEDINDSLKHQCDILGLDFDRLKTKNANACVCYVEDKGYAGVWALFNIRKIDDGIILHECVHLCFNLLSVRGIHHNKYTDEVYAYTTQWLFNKIRGYHSDCKNKFRNHRKKKV